MSGVRFRGPRLSDIPETWSIPAQIEAYSAQLSYLRPDRDHTSIAVSAEKIIRYRAGTRQMLLKTAAADIHSFIKPKSRSLALVSSQADEAFAAINRTSCSSSVSSYSSKDKSAENSAWAAAFCASRTSTRFLSSLNSSELTLLILSPYSQSKGIPLNAEDFFPNSERAA